MRYHELVESNALEYYADMAKAHDLDMNNGAVRKMIETADNIHANCQFYLQQIKGVKSEFPLDAKMSIAYRGMNSKEHHETAIVLKDVRLGDRNPADSDKETHDYINREFTKLYGQPFRNALFITGNRSETQRYGYTFQVFPVGQFKFIWSRSVKDLWVEGRDMRRTLRLPTGDTVDSETRLKNEKYKSAVFKEFHERVISQYESTDMKAAIGSGKEIMVRCKQYYAVNFDNMTNQVLDGRNTSDSYWGGIRTNLEKVFYNIVNNK